MTGATVHVRPMQRRDVDALMPHERGMFGPEAWSRGSYLDELADVRTRRYVVAVDGDGALLGWAGVRVVADEAEILTVGVLPAARRRGTARRLVRELLAVAAGRGAAQAYLEVRIDNDAARALYASEGFADVGRRRGYYENGRVDAIVMRAPVSET